MLELARNSRRAALALAFGAALSALPAIAQPGPGGDRIIHAITAFKAQLNLNTSQQAQWDAAVAASKAARDAAKQRRLTVRQVVTDELAKPTPDLSHIAAAADHAQDATVAARRQVRAQWLQLYSTFTAEQVAVVKSGIERHMSRMEGFRERMRERFGRNQ